jgi:ABC-2 type transport system ATP-binding protein
LYAIETQGLTKRFKQLGGYRDLALYRWRRQSTLAVEDMSLSIAPGELFGLLGENGAGKSTLIRMLSTTLLPTSGVAMVGGADVVRAAQAVRRRIGLVSGDERSFYWRLTGRQNLTFFAALYRLPERLAGQRIDELLATLDIGSYADRPFSAYSSGIRQKFALARGMLTRPDILFLDEPTRALDPIAADDLRRYIVEHIVGQAGHTVFLATHTLAEAEAICDRVAIVRHGRIVASGTMAELRAQMALRPVLELDVHGDGAAVRDAVLAVAGVQDVAIEPVAGLTRLVVRSDDEDGSVDAVLRSVVGSGVSVASFTARQPTLDDIYRAVHAPS